jgi:hypothetical protein
MLEDVFRDLGSHISFHTAITAGGIPTQAGIYAWFLPFRIKGRNPGDYAGDLLRVLTYCSRVRGEPKDAADLHLSWDWLEISLHHSPRVGSWHAHEAKWQSIASDPTATAVFKEALLAASIFARPLYVGLTRDLRNRYTEHTAGPSGFRDRFNSYAADLGLSLTTHDLLFACIRFNTSPLNDEQVAVLEWLLKQACHPPFGRL